MIELSDVAARELARRVAYEQAEQFQRIDLRDDCVKFLMERVHAVQRVSEMRHAYTYLTVNAKN